MFVLKDVNTLMTYVAGFGPAGQVVLDSDIQNAMRWDTVGELIRDLRASPEVLISDQDPLKVVRIRGNRFVEDRDVS